MSRPTHDAAWRREADQLRHEFRYSLAAGESCHAFEPIHLTRRDVAQIVAEVTIEHSDAARQAEREASPGVIDVEWIAASHAWTSEGGGAA